MKDITVRRIKKQDFAQFFEVFSRSFGQEIEIMGLDLQRFMSIVRFYDLISVLSRMLEVVNVYLPTILVAVSKEDAVLGGVHLVPFGRGVWTIDSLVVDPSYRRRGIGVRLISEAVAYVWTGRGEKALTYVRADNMPSLRIRRRLHGEFFDRRLFLMAEVDERPIGNISGDFVIRDVQPRDVSDVYRFCSTLDHQKAVTFELSPSSFLSSVTERVASRLGWSSSKRWVLESQGQVVGYVHLTYSSPKEAARIESFYILGPSDLYAPTALLLNRVFDTLRAERIRKVVVSLNEDWKELIRVFEDLGFTSLMSFYGVAHALN